jgi:16S rRNA (guanine966-N2)-methyltransferase
MTDRVRTSLFDRLASMGYMDAPAALDIFAGTGSVGIEALSRGVEHVTFIERDASARKLLQANLDDLGLRDRSLVLASNALTPAWVNLLAHRPVELIFCDPPYPMSEGESTRPSLEKLLDQLAPIASEDALLVLRTSEHTPAIPSTTWPDPVTRGYGSMLIHYYQKTPA